MSRVLLKQLQLGAKDRNCFKTGLPPVVFCDTLSLGIYCCPVGFFGWANTCVYEGGELCAGALTGCHVQEGAVDFPCRLVRHTLVGPSHCGQAWCKKSVSIKIDALPLYVYRKMPLATLELTTHQHVAEEPYQYAGAHSCPLDCLAWFFSHTDFSPMNFSGFCEIIHSSLPWWKQGESDWQSGDCVHVVRPSWWVDLQGKMPMNILRRWPQV